MPVSKQYHKRFIWAPEAIFYKEIEILGVEYQHLVKVSRAREKEFVSISNGCGKIFSGSIKLIDKKRCLIEILELQSEELTPPSLDLAIGFLKGRDLEEVVDLCCQLPLRSITPIITERSQSPDRDCQKLIERMTAKSLNGLKQAHKAWLTKINEPISLTQHLKENQGAVLFMEPTVRNEKPELKDSSITLYCGPEGGFTPEEIELFKNHPQAFPYHLGKTILRARHAPHFALGKLSSDFPHLFI